MILTLKKIQHKGVDRIGICFPYSSLYNLHYSFATNLIETGTDMKYIQELPGHSGIKATMFHACNQQSHQPDSKSVRQVKLNNRR